MRLIFHAIQVELDYITVNKFLLLPVSKMFVKALGIGVS